MSWPILDSHPPLSWLALKLSDAIRCVGLGAGGADRQDWRQAVRHQLPPPPRVPAEEELARTRPDVDPRGVLFVGVHPLPEDRVEGLLREAVAQRRPAHPLVLRAPDEEPAVRRHARGPGLFRSDVHPLRVVEVDRDREAEARRKVADDLLPRLPVIVAPVLAAMVLLEDDIGAGGVAHHVVGALPVLGVLVRHEVCAEVVVLEGPRLSAVLRLQDPHRGDGDMHRPGVPRVHKDRVQAHATGSRVPLRPRLLIVESLVQSPGLPLVFAPEEPCRVKAAVDDSGLVLHPRLYVPDLLCRPVGALWEPRGLPSVLPGLPQVAALRDRGALDEIIDGREHRLASWVEGRVVDGGPLEVRSRGLPSPPPVGGLEDENPLPRAEHDEAPPLQLANPSNPRSPDKSTFPPATEGRM